MMFPSCGIHLHSSEPSRAAATADENRGRAARPAYFLKPQPQRAPSFRHIFGSSASHARPAELQFQRARPRCAGWLLDLGFVRLAGHVQNRPVVRSGGRVLHAPPSCGVRSLGASGATGTRHVHFGWVCVFCGRRPTPAQSRALRRSWSRKEADSDVVLLVPEARTISTNWSRC